VISALALDTGLHQMSELASNSSLSQAHTLVEGWVILALHGILLVEHSDGSVRRPEMG
jgi:hypothetical protein